METSLPIPQIKASAEETALLIKLYALKSDLQDLLGKRIRIEINVSDVPTDKLKFIKDANIRVGGSYGEHATIDSIAGKINLYGVGHMPF